MPIYFGRYTDQGPKRGATHYYTLPEIRGIGGSGAIDLRADGGIMPDGGGFPYALVYTPQSIPTPTGWEKIADEKGEIVSEATRGRIASILKQSAIGVRGTTINDVLFNIVKTPPPNGWNPLRPNRNGKLQVHLGGLLQEETLPKGGGSLGQIVSCSPHHYQDSFQRWKPRTVRDILRILWEEGGYTDAFTNSNGTALSTHDSTWVLNTGTAEIQGNAVTDDQGIITVARWNDTFANDQYAEMDYTAEAVGANFFYGGPASRVQTSGQNGYLYVAFHDNADEGRFLQKVVAGAFTDLGVVNVGITPTITLRLTCDGSTISALLNGSTDGALSANDVTDTSFSSGQGGIVIFSNTLVGRLDNWDSGDLVVGTSFISQLLTGVGT